MRFTRIEGLTHKDDSKLALAYKQWDEISLVCRVGNEPSLSR